MLRVILKVHESPEVPAAVRLPPEIASLAGKLLKGSLGGEINGVKIRNLRQLSELLRDANDEFLTFDFAEKYSETIVFDRKEMQAVTEDILTDNGIRKQFSDNLREIWEKK